MPVIPKDAKNNLSCAGRTIYRGLVQSKVPEGEWIGLVGSGGGLGHLGIQVAKALGMKVVGIDAKDEGLELSKKNGADLIVDARKSKEDVVKEVQEHTGGEGCYATLCISDAKTAADLACGVTRMHGRMIQIAQVSRPRESFPCGSAESVRLIDAQPKDISITFEEIIFRDIRVEGSLLCTVQQTQDMLDLVAQHNITVKTNPFHGLEKLPDLLDLVHGGKLAGKGIIIVDEQAMKTEREATSEKLV